jgi:hypothetical protein
MNEELEPVGDHEFILRRVPASYYDGALPVPIQRAAFRPNRNDDTGISVYRERFVLQPADVVLAVAPEKRGKYYVCRLIVRDVTKLELTVQPEPATDGIRGHCVIPELSWSNYDTDHDRMAEIGHELAILASRDIVLRPTG